LDYNPPAKKKSADLASRQVLDYNPPAKKKSADLASRQKQAQ